MSQVLNENLSLEGNKLPTSAQQIGTVIKFELLNYFRSRRFFILLSISLVIAGMLTVLAADYGAAEFGSTALIFYSAWWGFSATYVVIFCAIFFGGDAISGEFQNRTGYFLLGNPIRRSSIYIGKWVAALSASLIILGAFTAVTLANGAYYFGGSAFPLEFGESILFSLVYLISILGFTFFFSSLFKSSSMSILVTSILLLFGFTVIERIVENIAHIEPWFLLPYGASIINNILTVPYPVHSQIVKFGLGGASSFTTYTATVPEGLIIMLAYFAVTVVLGLVLFEKKELN